jgi:ABC-type multidrug transport system fused ATPase/permease subunit
MKIKEKILENLVQILISVLAVITVLPILEVTIKSDSPSQFGVQLFSIIIVLFWIIFFIVFTVKVAIKENQDDALIYKKSVRNFKRSLLSVIIILTGSYIIAQIDIKNYYKGLRSEHLLRTKQKEIQYVSTIDSLKAFVGNDSLISTYFFELGEEYIRTDSIKRGFDYFDSALYYHKSSHYYGVIAYHLKHSLNNKVKALEYDKKAYALDTSRKYLLNFIKDLENEIEEEKE